MCGIAGIIATGRATNSGDRDQRLEELARGMARELGHRGPDGEGAWSAPGVALAHRRLSILDLSNNGAQPMDDPTGRHQLVLNGEIYNHRELRAELPEPDGGWRSTSDTETLLRALVCWGAEKTLPRLRGMFAFGWWNAEAQTLTLARDPFGEKPLYYATLIHDGAPLFAFASELPALRRLPGFHPEVDRAALGQYLRYCYVPEPSTIYRDAKKLPPGHLLEVRAGKDHASRQWFSLSALMDAATPFEGSDEDATDAFLEVLGRSVERQLISDVPLGALLSGGVDSTLIAALMQRASSTAIRTFTIGYDDPAWDESESAAAVAAHLGTEHTTLTARPEHALALVPELAKTWAEPFADPSQLPTALVCALTREHVTVALSGDGGDELFAGYNRHAFGPKLWAKFARLPRPLRAGVGRLLSVLSPDSFDKIARELGATARLPGQKLSKLASVMGARSRQEFYTGLCSCWREPAALLASGAEAPLMTITPGGGPNAWFSPLPGCCPPERDFTAWMQFMDCVTYLPGDILTKVDRAAMRVALETRAPFLDPDVAAFACSLPSRLRIDSDRGKVLPRLALARLVPPELTERPKMGFGVPLNDWLKGPLREWAETLLAEERLRNDGFLNPGPVRAAWTRLKMGRSEEQFRVWNVLMFQAWAEEWA